jgi:hypothetical protein
MYFLEQRCQAVKRVRGAAGLGNSNCAMPLHTTEWKQVVASESKDEIEGVLNSIHPSRREEYRIVDNGEE